MLGKTTGGIQQGYCTFGTCRVETGLGNLNVTDWIPRSRKQMCQSLISGTSDDSNTNRLDTQTFRLNGDTQGPNHNCYSYLCMALPTFRAIAAWKAVPRGKEKCFSMPSCLPACMIVCLLCMGLGLNQCRIASVLPLNHDYLHVHLHPYLFEKYVE